jgi:hypothetical protein
MFQDYKNTFLNKILTKSNNRSKKDMMNNIYKIVFNLNKSILCSNMLKTISFAQSCTLKIYIYDPMG